MNGYASYEVRSRHNRAIAWFIVVEDAEDFIKGLDDPREGVYTIHEVNKIVKENDRWRL